MIGGISVEHRDEVQAAVGHADMLFHDGEHSRRGYVEDFAAFEPLLAPGALVAFDDIRWALGGAEAAADTYEGWREVVAHPPRPPRRGGG